MKSARSLKSRPTLRKLLQPVNISMNCTHGVTVPVSAIPFPPEQERCIRSDYSRQSAACATHPLVGVEPPEIGSVQLRHAADQRERIQINRHRDTPVAYRLAAWHWIIIGGEPESSIPSHSSMPRRGSFSGVGWRTRSIRSGNCRSSSGYMF